MPKFNAETDHGRVVWAKMFKSSKSWPAIIISPKILGLVFEEQPEKIWVFWIGGNTFTLLKSHLIFNFYDDFADHFGNPSASQFRNISYALSIISDQFGFDLPDKLAMFSHKKLSKWVKDNLKSLTYNRLGKRKRGEKLFIPIDIIKVIKKIDSKNVRTLIQENIINEICDVNGLSRVANSKQKLKYCFSCRRSLKEKDKLYSHPLFIGSVCEVCYEKVENVLLPIAKDRWNMDCCICLGNDSKDKLVLCDFCIRVYCENCVSIYNLKGGFNQILRTVKWKCFSCENLTAVNYKLLSRHTLDKQLHNVFSLYRGDICNPNKIRNVNNKPEEVHVFALEDIQNNVSTVLKQLQHPFKLDEISNLDDFSNNYDGIHETVNTDKTSHIKLLLQYYPNSEHYDEAKFNSDGTIEMFLNFILKRDRIELKYPNDLIFWAFETSAAIKYEDQKFITRYCGKKPILSTMYSEDVRQRGRFIWSNITICEKNVAAFRKYDIFTKKMNLKEKENPKPWCFDSVKLMLTSLIKNNIV